MIAFELRMLAFTVVLGLVHVTAASHAASWQRGYRWTASSRDEPVGPLVGVAGRLARALSNFSETFPWFAALVLAVLASGKTGQLSELGVSLYFFGRVAYLVLYALGVPLIRSVVWNVATLGIVLLLVALVWS